MKTAFGNFHRRVLKLVLGLYPIPDDFPDFDQNSVRITTSSLPDGEVNSAYAAQIAAIAPPNAPNAELTYSVDAGHLPLGLGLAVDGEITGSPEIAGMYTFVVVADAEGDNDMPDFREFTILIE